MNLAWKIVVFTLLLNISSGIMTSFLGIETNIQSDPSVIDKVDIYDVNNPNQTFVDTIPVTGEVNWADNLLGLLGLGFIVDLVNLLTDYLFGLTDILLAILPAEAEGMRPWLNGLITIAYTFALFSLFTGKNLNEDG